MSGYNFGGEKARMIKRRLRELKRDPDAARALFGLPTVKREGRE